jgi:signal peptide peptidase SppA
MPRGIKNAISEEQKPIHAKRPLYPVILVAGWMLLTVAVYGYLLLSDSAAEPSVSNDGYAQGAGEFTFTTASGEECNVMGIAFHGGITTYLPRWWQEDQGLSPDEKNMMSSEYITAMMDEANSNDKVRAVILEVDSSGGSPVAGEEIAESIMRSEKPVIGYIRGIAASAAYWAISPAYPIYASRNSDIGGIGVTASYAEKIDDDTKFIQLSTGKYKDAGNPDKPITDEEMALIMRDVEIIHENFIQAIAKNRNLDVKTIRAIADGSTVLGEAAKKLGLIDELGSLYDISEYLESKLGERPLICWY